MWSDLHDDTPAPVRGEDKVDLERCCWGEPVNEETGDWVPITEAAEVCGVGVAAVLDGLGSREVRWKVAWGECRTEVYVWLPDVLGLPGAHW
jgi:hypothetical protein